EELGDLVTTVMRSHLQAEATHLQAAQGHLDAGSSRRRTLRRTPEAPKPDARKHFTLSVHDEPRELGREIWIWRGVALVAGLALLVSLPRVFGDGPSPKTRGSVSLDRTTAEAPVREPPAADVTDTSAVAPPVIVPVAQPVTSVEHPAPTRPQPPARPR